MHNHLTHRSVEGRKELVFGKDFALRKQVEESRFSHVGVAHQCHTHHLSAVLSLRCLLSVDVCQTFFEERHTVEDDASVHFELCFTRTTQTHATSFATTGTTGATTLTFQVRPKALQTRKHVAILRQFDLRFCIRRLCAHGKDI